MPEPHAEAASSVRTPADPAPTERSSSPPSPQSALRLLPPLTDLAALDARVLTRWRETAVFARSLEQTRDGEHYVVYEGPPTANGKPGTHHVEARVFKDLYPRYQTMRGRYSDRRAGWDCHGLPVELAVEKELGFTGKADIETYGVAEFNAKCRESVLAHVAEFTALTERIGYWVDFDRAYRTMDTSYVESVWWSLQRIHEAGLLVEDHRVAPWCPRDQTGLSDHEVAQGYTEVTDPSVYVRFPIDGQTADLDGVDLLVWTTTPWTLVSNTAVAANPHVTYAVVETDGRPVLVAQALVEKAVGEGARVRGIVQGRDLERVRYRRPFTLVDLPTTSDASYIVLADYVTTDDGTGLVHQAPAFGAEDMAVARTYGLPVVNPIGPDGRFHAEVPLIGGVFFKDADAALVDDLRERGLLWRYQPYTHTYPLCWRCDTPLLYWATPSWYIRTTARKDELLRENAKTDWHPQTIRNGRYGEWLRNNVDWALSRNRYWGTPLPVWRCTRDASHPLTVIGSLAELTARSGVDCRSLDPHRPYVDAVTIPCPACGAEQHRVPEVIDAWYDSGSMPFAQDGYPHLPGSIEKVEHGGYPAQLICEAIDQTRGWFYTLMAVGTLVFDRSSYESVLCLGHIVDENGRKMSKHLGNVLDPFEVLDRHGADALRWLMLCAGNPWSTRRVGHEVLDEVVRTLLLTFWNSASFLCLYADAARWSPPSDLPKGLALSTLDRWLLAEVQDTIAEVSSALDAYDSTRAGRRIAQLVDDLSNWYVRRSRRRFWDGDDLALATLHHCVRLLTQVLAPFVPFIADEVWQHVRRANDADSVHLSTWPALTGWDDDALRAQMSTLRRLVELGRAARASSGVKTRQPLGRALVSVPGAAAPLPEELLRELADELNVEAVAPLAAQDELVDVVVKPGFRALGKRFGGRTKEVAEQVGAATFDRAAGTVTVTLDGEQHVLSGEELLVTESPREGWAVASGDGLSVALDLNLTPHLVRSGLAREAVRAINDGRKAAGLAITDRIRLWWTAKGETAEAMAEHADRIAKEVLAVSISPGPPGRGGTERRDEQLGLWFWMEVTRP